MYLACGTFGYILNKIGVIFHEFVKTENQIKENMYIINKYMKQKKINKKLSYQIREYVEYYW